MNFDNPHYRGNTTVESALARAQQQIAAFRSREEQVRNFNERTLVFKKKSYTLALLFSLTGTALFAAAAVVEMSWPTIKAKLQSIEEQSRQALPAPPTGEYFNPHHHSRLKL